MSDKASATERYEFKRDDIGRFKSVKRTSRPDIKPGVYIQNNIFTYNYYDNQAIKKAFEEIINKKNELEFQKTLDLLMDEFHRIMFSSKESNLEAILTRANSLRYDSIVIFKESLKKFDLNPQKKTFDGSIFSTKSTLDILLNRAEAHMYLLMISLIISYLHDSVYLSSDCRLLSDIDTARDSIKKSIHDFLFNESSNEEAFVFSRYFRMLNTIEINDDIRKANMVLEISPTELLTSLVFSLNYHHPVMDCQTLNYEVICGTWNIKNSSALPEEHYGPNINALNKDLNIELSQSNGLILNHLLELYSIFDNIYNLKEFLIYKTKQGENISNFLIPNAPK